MDDLINLTDNERAGLQAALSAGLNAKQYRRAQALQLLDEGAAVSEVAELLGVSRQTVDSWSSRFQNRRSRPVPQRLLDASRDGRPATVGEIIDELLDEVLDAEPRMLGYRSTVWTAALFQDYLQESFRIGASRRSVQYALGRLRIRWKRPRHTLALRAPAWRQAKGA